MEAKKRRFTLDKKMYLFIFTMIFFTVASLVDADFYKELRALADH